MRYDRQCALFPSKNPASAFFLLVCMTGSIVTFIRGFQYFSHWATASDWQRIHAVGGTIGLICMGVLAWFLYRRYRHGQYVAVTTEGLILRLVGHTTELIPWSRVVAVEARELPLTKPQVARVRLCEPAKKLELGGLYNVFPTREAVDRFVEQVRQRSNGPSQQVPQGSTLRD